MALRSNGKIITDGFQKVVGLQRMIGKEFYVVRKLIEICVHF